MKIALLGYGRMGKTIERYSIDRNHEIVFILELSTKENSVEDVEDFTQYLSDFIVKREPSTVYGYFISEDGKNVTLIERYNTVSYTHLTLPTKRIV